ncbi:Glycine betaine transport system permease protein OpuAB, partial [Geodia barretti]
LPWTVVVAVAIDVGVRLGGRWLGLFCGAATLFIGFNGYWDSAMLTMSVVGVSVIIAVGIGVPIGIFAAFSNRFRGSRPPDSRHHAGPACLRILIPALVLFGVSGTQGVFLTVVYCIPPVIRLTNLGIRQVPQAAMETAHSHGSTTSQTLFQVQLPLAKSSIMMGINQTIMMAVAMVIITALVGVDGLGRDVWLSLREVDAGKGLESGIAIVLLAIILDRLSYALANSGPNSAMHPSRPSVRAHEETAGRAFRTWLPATLFPFRAWV